MQIRNRVDATHYLKTDPRAYLRVVFNVHLWQKQADIIESVRDNKYTIVKSGHGVGKTFVAACCVLWYLYNHPDSLVITTAPTARQVKELLWREIAKLHHDDLGGELQTLRLKITKEWEAIGFTARESSDHEKMATKFQGFHNPFQLFVLDEAAGIHPAIWRGIKACITGENNKLLAIGNPTSPFGAFFDAFKNDSYNRITISCFDHPNIKSGKELIQGAVTREWIEDAQKEWGKESPLYQSRVIAKFPQEGEDTLIPLTKLEESVHLTFDPVKYKKPRSIGVDVARFGSDKTYIILQEDHEQKQVVYYNGKDLNWTIAKIKELDEIFQADCYCIDDTGVGGGVTDGLKDFVRQSDNKGAQIFPINFGGAPIEGLFPLVEFENIKAEMFWQLRHDILNKKLKILDEASIISHLSTITYDYTSSQKIKITSKKEMKQKGLPSPDAADATALANLGVKLLKSNLQESTIEDDGSKDTISPNLTTEQF